MMKTPRFKSVRMIVFGAFSAIFFCFSSYAETTRSDKWNFQLAPYAWLAGQNGKVATLPSLPPADIDVDFYDDILGNINGAIMLVGEARKGRYGVVMDVAYADIEAEESTSGPFFSSVESRTKSWIVSAAGLYRLIEKDRAFLDVVGGVFDIGQLSQNCRWMRVCCRHERSQTRRTG